MRRVVIVLLFIGFLGLCHRVRQFPAPLPHRQAWELFRQANSPSRADCDSPRLSYYVELTDGSQIFLECLRGQTND
jgi:hypothetical protein